MMLCPLNMYYVFVFFPYVFFVMVVVSCTVLGIAFTSNIHSAVECSRSYVAWR